MKATLEKDGVRAAVSVVPRILSGLYNCDPYFLAETILDDLTPVERERALRAVVSYIGMVVRLEKETTLATNRSLPRVVIIDLTPYL